jgi:hypothetical protein
MAYGCDDIIQECRVPRFFNTPHLWHRSWYYLIIRIPTLFYSADEHPETLERLLRKRDKVRWRVPFSAEWILGLAGVFTLFGFGSWGIRRAWELVVRVSDYGNSWILCYIIGGRTFKDPPLTLGCASRQSKLLPPIFTLVISYTTVL